MVKLCWYCKKEKAARVCHMCQNAVCTTILEIVGRDGIDMKVVHVCRPCFYRKMGSVLSYRCSREAPDIEELVKLEEMVEDYEASKS